MAEVTYYFDVGLGVWSDPSYAFDNILSNFASTANDGYYEQGQETNCDGTDLGTITKVEIRLYAYGDGNDRIDISFGGSPTTPEYQLIPAASEGWTGYVDVTSDPNVNGWTWAKIADPTPDCILEYDKSGKGNTMYCAKVEIRVTYTPSAGYYHGLTVQGVGELALCDVGSHPLRIRKGGTTYGIELVDTTDGNASVVRIRTPLGLRSIRKYT